MKTGVFFNDILKTHEWPIIGNKFRNFPRVMEEVLKRQDVFLFEARPVSEELLLKVHVKGFVEDVKTRWYYGGASYAVGGCVEAAEKVWTGEVDNALVFGVAAGHHAGPSSSWGGIYISCTGPAIRNLRDRFRIERFAILDTDSHHGDGRGPCSWGTGMCFTSVSAAIIGRRTRRQRWTWTWAGAFPIAITWRR